MGQTPSDDDKNEPSLELPSLRLRAFGRRKKTAAPPEATEPPEQAQTPEPTARADEAPTQPLHLDNPEAEPEVASAAEPPPAPEVEETPSLYVDEVADQDRPGAQVVQPVQQVQQVDELPAEQTDPGRRKTQRSTPRMPALAGRVAAIVTGVVVGLFGTLAFYVSLQGCEAVNGTQTCGGTGFFLLVAILIIMVLLGGVMLKAWKVSDPRSTSFLAVGVLCVIVLVTLMEELFSAWMFVFVPVISAAAYALSYWVTTRFVDAAERGPDHDVR